MVDDPDIPRLARVPLIIVGAGFVGLFTWLMIWRADDLATRALYAAMILYGVWSFRRSLSTELTMAGVSQWTLTGRVSMSWSEVRSVRTSFRGAMTLDSDRERIVIWTRTYWDYFATISWIHQRLDHVAPSDWKGRRYISGGG
jgi:hypothetical protein